MSAEAWDMIITAAEEGGLFVERDLKRDKERDLKRDKERDLKRDKERDLERDIEKAKRMLLDGVPVEKVAEWMEFSIETVRALL